MADNSVNREPVVWKGAEGTQMDVVVISGYS